MMGTYLTNPKSQTLKEDQRKETNGFLGLLLHLSSEIWNAAWEVVFGCFPSFPLHKTKFDSQIFFFVLTQFWGAAITFHEKRLPKRVRVLSWNINCAFHYQNLKDKATDFTSEQILSDCMQSREQTNSKWQEGNDLTQFCRHNVPQSHFQIRKFTFKKVDPILGESVSNVPAKVRYCSHSWGPQCWWMSLTCHCKTSREFGITFLFGDTTAALNDDTHHVSSRKQGDLRERSR